MSRFFLLGLAFIALQCHGGPSPVQAEGQLIYEQRCGNCHDLPRVTDYNDSGWKRVVSDMSHEARLTDAQKVELSNWLQENNARP